MIPTPQEDYVAIATSHITSVFQKPNILAWTSVYAARYQRIENAYLAYLAALLEPYGAMLDQFGQLFGGLLRQGLDDTQYLAALQVQLLTLRSNGTAPALINICLQYLVNGSGGATAPEVLYHEFGGPTLDLCVLGIANPNLLAGFLLRARAGAKTLTLSYDSAGSVYTGDVKFPAGGSGPSPFVLDYGGSLGTTGLGYGSFQERYPLGLVTA